MNRFTVGLFLIFWSSSAKVFASAPCDSFGYDVDISTSAHATLSEYPSQIACENQAIKYCNSNLNVFYGQASTACTAFCAEKGCGSSNSVDSDGCKFVGLFEVDDDGGYLVCQAEGTGVFGCQCSDI